MVNDTRSAGDAPAARSAVATFPAATSNCSTRVVPTIAPETSCAVCPPRYTVRPGPATTACANPTGSPRPDALTVSFTTAPRRLGAAVHGRPVSMIRSQARSFAAPLWTAAGGPRRVELRVVVGLHQQRLGHRFQLDRAAEVHVQLAGQQHLRRRVRQRRAVREPPGQRRR